MSEAYLVQWEEGDEENFVYHTEDVDAVLETIEEGETVKVTIYAEVRELTREQWRAENC